MEAEPCNRQSAIGGLHASAQERGAPWCVPARPNPLVCSGPFVVELALGLSAPFLHAKCQHYGMPAINACASPLPAIALPTHAKRRWQTTTASTSHRNVPARLRLLLGCVCQAKRSITWLLTHVRHLPDKLQDHVDRSTAPAFAAVCSQWLRISRLHGGPRRVKCLTCASGHGSRHHQASGTPSPPRPASNRPLHNQRIAANGTKSHTHRAPVDLHNPRDD